MKKKPLNLINASVVIIRKLIERVDKSWLFDRRPKARSLSTPDIYIR